MILGPVGTVLFWAGTIAIAMALKNYVRRFAGWNLFLLICLVFFIEIVLWVLAAVVLH